MFVLYLKKPATIFMMVIKWLNGCEIERDANLISQPFQIGLLSKNKEALF